MNKQLKNGILSIIIFQDLHKMTKRESIALKEENFVSKKDLQALSSENDNIMVPPTPPTSQPVASLPLIATYALGVLDVDYWLGRC